MKYILLLMLLIPSFTFAYTLDLIKGITVYTINGDDVTSKKANSLSLLKGKNQLALHFNGKLREKNKKTHFQSKPYLLTLDVNSDVKISIVSSKYDKIIKLNKEDKPLFKANTIILEQKRLPAISKIIPYRNIPALVSHYNEVNGIFFSEDGLETLTKPEIEKQQEAKESKVLAQLKYWYSQATKEEISAFEKWKVKK